MTLGILMGLGLAGNLLTLYMFYEMMTLITVPLVIHNGSREAVAAGFKYLGYSTFGAGLAVDRIFLPQPVLLHHRIFSWRNAGFLPCSGK